MQHRKTGTGYFLRMDRGEEVVATLEAFLAEAGVTFASLRAVGALDEVELGFFDASSRSYRRRKFSGGFEIAGLAGNVSLVDRRPFPHLHVTLSDSEYRVVGGHLFRGRVSVTCEMEVAVHEGEVERRSDDETGLKLMRLSDQ